MNTEEKEKSDTGKRTRRRTPNVDGLRLFAEVWVLVCQLVSLATLVFQTTIPDGLSWTLLSLCITTITTFLQFRKEVGEYGKRIPLLSAPSVAFVAITVILGLACLIDEMKPFVESKFVGIVVCTALVIRQSCHILTLTRFYEKG